MDIALRKKIFIFSALGLLVVISDQLSKILIRLRGGFYICNPHIALGIEIPAVIFWIFWLVTILLIAYNIYKKCFAHDTLYIILIFSGALSNLVDRFWHGCIIDFINLGFGPIFNLADFFISLGAIMLVIAYLKVKH